MPILVHTLRRRLSSWRICHACEKRFASTSSVSPASRKLPGHPARTRFAPSPTGYLHLGSLRTALFNFLLAKATGGQFLLRIEDTDQKRTISDAEDRLFQDLEWAGLKWDEGPKIGGPYGPYKQSQRTALYREHAEKLLASGNAYRCFCSPERLRKLAELRTKHGLPAEYDRSCMHVSLEESEDRASKGEAHVIRLKVPDKYPEYHDLVYGWVRNRKPKSRVAHNHPTFDDPILLKSDGFPTYHLANVVDDYHMDITHVVRGAEWMSSTPKHLALYDAFGWSAPVYAHVGLLLDKTRQKLSKRNMDLDISAFRDKMGIFPETLTNFVALLGWSHGLRKDIMSFQELIDNFDMKFTTGDTVVTFEKLWFLQRAHAARYAYEQSIGSTSNLSLMLAPLKLALENQQQQGRIKTGLTGGNLQDYLTRIVKADARNYTNASAFLERNRYFFEPPDRAKLVEYLPPPPTLHHMPAEISFELSAEKIIKTIHSALDSISQNDWTSSQIQNKINGVIRKNTETILLQSGCEEDQFDVEITVKAIQSSCSKWFHKYIRWSMTGAMPGPDGAETMSIMGREETLRRLQSAACVLADRSSNQGDISGLESSPTV